MNEILADTFQLFSKSSSKSSAKIVVTFTILPEVRDEDSTDARFHAHVDDFRPLLSVEMDPIAILCAIEIRTGRM